MEDKNILRNHLKHFTVKELKQEVIKVKKGFQVSKLKCAEVEGVILNYYFLFNHLLKKNLVKKKLVKKPKFNVTKYVKNLLKELDSTKPNVRNAAYLKEPMNKTLLQKTGSKYLVRDYYDMNKILIPPMTDRKQFEQSLIHMLQ